MHCLAINRDRVEWDLLDFLDGFKGPRRPLRLRGSISECMQVCCEGLGLDDGFGIFATLNVTIVGVP